MYFWKNKGKQYMDMRGDLLLTHNPVPVRCRSKGNAPKLVTKAKFICGIGDMGPFLKLRATWSAARFIWRKQC